MGDIQRSERCLRVRGPTTTFCLVLRYRPTEQPETTWSQQPSLYRDDYMFV